MGRGIVLAVMYVDSRGSMASSTPSDPALVAEELGLRGRLKKFGINNDKGLFIAVFGDKDGGEKKLIIDADFFMESAHSGPPILGIVLYAWVGDEDIEIVFHEGETNVTPEDFIRYSLETLLSRKFAVDIEGVMKRIASSGG